MSINPKTLFFLFLCFTVVSSTLYAQETKGRRWYVNVANKTAENNDGLSWQSAFIDLQHALKNVRTSDTIWVAAGTYLPTSSSDRSISFKIPKGIKIFGGFSGKENKLDERNWKLNRSILSGDIGIKDAYEDNSFHVLMLLNTDSTTLINGLCIEKAKTLSGGTLESTSGGGILITSSDITAKNNPIIENCEFRNNSSVSGGAIAILSNFSMGNVKINNSIFEENHASGSGGGIYWFSFDPRGTISLQDCNFKSNKAAINGSILFSLFSGDLNIKNSNFTNNETNGSSGIIMAGNFLCEYCSFSEEKMLSGAEIFISPIRSNDQQTAINVSILNTTFSSIRNNLEGSIINLIADDNEFINTLIQGCLFSRNQSKGSIINIRSSQGKNQIFFHLDQCTFTQNGTQETGQQSVTNLDNYSSQPIGIEGKITNSIFFKNDQPFVLNQNTNSKIKFLILNSTFVKNNTGVINNSGGVFSINNEVYLQNSIFYAPFSSLSSILQNNTQAGISAFSFNHCLFSASACTATGDTTRCGTGNMFGSYPQFIDSSNVQGLKLAPGSIAINAGRWHPELTALDLLGQNRVQDCQPDLGAYESPSLLSSEDTLQVKAQVRSTPVNMSVGEIAIQQISGGFPPYRIRWENGDSTSVRSNLATGQYTLTINDQMGCFKVYTYTVPFTTSTNESEQRLEKIYFSPNPQRKDQAIRLHYENLPPGQWQVKIIDLSGRLIHQQNHLLQTNGVLNFAERLNLRAGMYLITLSNEGNSLSTKLMIAQ